MRRLAAAYTVDLEADPIELRDRGRRQATSGAALPTSRAVKDVLVDSRNRCLHLAPAEGGRACSTRFREGRNEGFVLAQSEEGLGHIGRGFREEKIPPRNEIQVFDTDGG